VPNLSIEYQLANGLAEEREIEKLHREKRELPGNVGVDARPSQ
jgi:hypothetical protein